MVKFTFFESYCAYNVLCLTFRGTVQVLIQRKTSGANSRKDRGPTEASGAKRKKIGRVHNCTPQGTVVLQRPQPHTGGMTTPMGTRVTMRQPRPTRSRDFSTIYMGFPCCFLGGLLLGSFEDQLGLD